MRRTQMRLVLNLCVMVVLSVSASTASGQMFTVLDNLHSSSGVNPASPLVQDRSANLAGSTDAGGANGHGTLFGITPQGKFVGISNNASGAGSIQLLLGLDGCLYGTTYAEGAHAGGTVFKVAPNGVIATIYTFSGQDGSFPTSGLTLGEEGNFYGTTSSGGAHKKGTIYKITPAGVLKPLHSFDGYNFFTHPSRLTLSNDGNFYGTTQNGQTSGVYGQVFQITPSGKFTILYEFTDPAQSPSLSGLTLGPMEISTVRLLTTELPGPFTKSPQAVRIPRRWRQSRYPPNRRERWEFLRCHIQWRGLLLRHDLQHHP